MMLINYEISRVDDSEPSAPSRSFRLCLKKQGIPTLHLAADTEPAASRWHTVLTNAAERSKMADTWLEQTKRNLALSPANMHRPDCFGYLNKLGSKWKTWTRRYCVLKDACLYFYQDANSKSSFGKSRRTSQSKASVAIDNCSFPGMACLHGYRVQQSTTGGKKHAFEVLPSDASQKHFYFHTETEMDRKRYKEHKSLRFF